VPHDHDAVAPAVKAEFVGWRKSAQEARIRVVNKNSIAIGNDTVRSEEEPNGDGPAFRIPAGPGENSVFCSKLRRSPFRLVPAMRTGRVHQGRKGLRFRNRRRDRGRVRGNGDAGRQEYEDRGDSECAHGWSLPRYGRPMPRFYAKGKRAPKRVVRRARWLCSRESRLTERPRGRIGERTRSIPRYPMKSIADQLPSEIARQIHADRRKNETAYWAETF